MRKIILLMHVSLDGFVSGPNGEIDWIKLDDEIFDFVNTISENSDTALYGRVTYQLMDNYWPNAGQKPNATKHDKEHSHWYNTVLKLVMSRTMGETTLTNTKIIGENFAEKLRQVKNSSGKNILMLGSPTAGHALTHEHLIDEYWIFLNPVLLGKGIPLFKDIDHMIHLKFSGSKNYPCGVTALHYERE
jgi:dihydrofolate reductase